MATSTKLLTPIFAMVFALSLAACEREEGPAEEAGKKSIARWTRLARR